MISDDDRQAITEIVCLVEKEFKQEDHKRERALVIIELVLLPIAVIVMLLIPSLAAPAVFIPNIVLRAYQIKAGNQQ